MQIVLYIIIMQVLNETDNGSGDNNGGGNNNGGRDDGGATGLKAINIGVIFQWQSF